MQETEIKCSQHADKSPRSKWIHYQQHGSNSEKTSPVGGGCGLGQTETANRGEVNQPGVVIACSDGKLEKLIVEEEKVAGISEN